MTKEFNSQPENSPNSDYYQQFRSDDPELLGRVFGTVGPRATPAASRGEAYARCSEQVVALVKCVDENKGPSWYWSCGEPYVALQKCYSAQAPAAFDSVKGLWKQLKETASVRWEKLGWMWEDISPKKQ